MGLYDPTFVRKEFSLATRAGEVPGSIVLGKGNKGCIWPGQNGKWFAARPNHPTDQPFPSFDAKDDALEHIVAPLRVTHESKEDQRKHAWEQAEPKRAKRAADTKAREAKRKAKKSDSVWAVLNADGEEVGRIVRPDVFAAMSGAASLLGFCKLPVGFDVKLADECPKCGTYEHVVDDHRCQEHARPEPGK